MSHQPDEIEKITRVLVAVEAVLIHLGKKVDAMSTNLDAHIAALAKVEADNQRLVALAQTQAATIADLNTRLAASSDDDAALPALTDRLNAVSAAMETVAPAV